MASIFGFTLKGIRTFRGRDWDGVQGSIYYKGKKVGWYNDSGDGGAADIDFDGTIEERRKMDELLKAAAVEYYKRWLKSIGCTQGILPYNLEEYAFCKARWLECEDMNTKHGLLVKDQNGKPMPSPFVGMAQQYLKQTNEVWSKIYIVVRESKEI